MKIGKLRHRITIQEPVEVQDPTTGEVVVTWQDVFENVPAEITPLSAKEFIGSKTEQSFIDARIVIRFREAINAKMRVLHKGQVYNPHGWLPDNQSGRRYLTAPCTKAEILLPYVFEFVDWEESQYLTLI
jgi:SPP1 family predicted phage head-tail adaptor